MAARGETEQIGDLLNLLREPGRYVERRTDEIGDLSSRSVDWTVRLQVRLPYGTGQPAPDVPYIVSLGLFPKKRLPDFVATDGSGCLVPLLRRTDRTRALVALLLQDVLHTQSLTVSQEAQLAQMLAQIVSGYPASAQAAFESYRTTISSMVAASPQLAEHLAFVAHFVQYTHVLAAVSGTPGSHLMVTYTYSERHALPARPNLTEPGAALGAQLKLLLRYWGMTLGLLPVPFDMKLGGANHAHSYYLLADSPSGTEIEALYWKSLHDRPATALPSGMGYVHESRRPCLACYHAEHDVTGGLARVDVRLHGGAMRLLWLVNVLLVLVGLFLARNAEEDLSSSVSLLAAIPAGLIALAAQNTHELTADLGKWVRRLYIGLSLLAAVVGISVIGDLIKGDSEVAGWINDERVASALAAYAAFMFGVVTYICFRREGPATSGALGNVRSYSDIQDYRSARRRNSLICVVASVALSALAYLFGTGKLFGL